jgi:hypothetical protein
MNFCVCSDGLHLSEEGSKIVVEEILKVLKEATDWDPCLHWKAEKPSGPLLGLIVMSH